MCKTKIWIAALTLSALCASPVFAGEGKHSIMPTLPEALEFQNAVGFADAVVVNEMIYLAGVVAVPMSGETSPQPAFERAFVAIEATLKRAGASWDDVVDLTTFHTDLAARVNDFVEVKNRYVKAPFPAWTAIGISTLYEPAALTEIKVVARKPNP